MLHIRIGHASRGTPHPPAAPSPLAEGRGVSITLDCAAMSRFDRLLSALATAQVSDRACNQYSRTVGDLRANLIRRRNLRIYLESFVAPDILLIGEAPSYRGGRLTGIP